MYTLICGMYALKLLKFSAKTPLSFPFSFHLFQHCYLPQSSLLGKKDVCANVVFKKKRTFLKQEEFVEDFSPVT